MKNDSSFKTFSLVSSLVFSGLAPFPPPPPGPRDTFFELCFFLKDLLLNSPAKFRHKERNEIIFTLERLVLFTQRNAQYFSSFI